MTEVTIFLYTVPYVKKRSSTICFPQNKLCEVYRDWHPCRRVFIKSVIIRALIKSDWPQAECFLVMCIGKRNHENGCSPKRWLWRMSNQFYLNRMNMSSQQMDNACPIGRQFGMGIIFTIEALQDWELITSVTSQSISHQNHKGYCNY